MEKKLFLVEFGMMDFWVYHIGLPEKSAWGYSLYTWVQNVRCYTSLCAPANRLSKATSLVVGGEQKMNIFSGDFQPMGHAPIQPKRRESGN